MEPLACAPRVGLHHANQISEVSMTNACANDIMFDTGPIAPRDTRGIWGGTIDKLHTYDTMAVDGPMDPTIINGTV